jgi:hypothetical protein
MGKNPKLKGLAQKISEKATSPQPRQRVTDEDLGAVDDGGVGIDNRQ